MKKQRKRAETASGTSRDEPAHRPAAAKFDVENAGGSQVVDEIGALRAALAAMEKSPFSAAAKAPVALRRLLEVIENLNLRLADLESGA